MECRYACMDFLTLLLLVALGTFGLSLYVCASLRGAPHQLASGLQPRVKRHLHHQRVFGRRRLAIKADLTMAYRLM